MSVEASDMHCYSYAKKEDFQIVKYKRDKKKVHPTQKPYDLMKMFVETYTIEDGWILDPFCGSRVLEDVCRDLNRNYIGVDITDYRMEENE